MGILSQSFLGCFGSLSHVLFGRSPIHIAYMCIGITYVQTLLDLHLFCLLMVPSCHFTSSLTPPPMNIFDNQDSRSTRPATMQ